MNDDLHHFTSRLGIEQAESLLLLPSPFDYSRRALLCVPRNLPQTNQPGSARQLAAMLRPIIEANNGRCFMLLYLARHDARSGRAVPRYHDASRLLQGKPAKGNCCSNLSAPVTRFLWQPAVSGKGGRAWRYIVIGDYRQIAVYLAG